MNNDSENVSIGTLALATSRAKLVGYVRKKVNDPAVAEDILQDSMLKAIRSVAMLRDEDRVLSWFYRILDNAVIDYYRRRSFEQRVFTPSDDENETGGVVEPVDVAVICACLRELLPTMKPEYAELIEKLELGNHEPEDVAQRLGITRNNLKVKRHRARQQLRERLEQTCRMCARHGCLDCSCTLSSAGPSAP